MTPKNFTGNSRNCQECGWRVDIMWSHRDCDVDVIAYTANAEALGEAVMLAALQAIRATKETTNDR